MFLLQTSIILKPSSTVCAGSWKNPYSSSNLRLFSSNHANNPGIARNTHCCVSPESESVSDVQPKARNRKPNSQLKEEGESETTPSLIKAARKPRRGRKSEAAAVEEFVRDSLGRAIAAIREKNPDALEEKEVVMKNRVDNDDDDDDDLESESDCEVDDEDEDDEGDGEDDVSVSGEAEKTKKKKKKKMFVKDDDPDWPVDADVGWGTRASEYFEKYPIKNVVGDDGFEIDWEGETDDNWVKEINCLEWESFAFHPSPLIVFIFERYNQATDNWKTLKELEKALKVYWNAKDRLPPRAVKIDINIERDLAYALKAKECPQILFLRGNKIVYREKDFRTSDELVHMIAHFYYNAKRPSCVNAAAVTR